MTRAEILEELKTIMRQIDGHNDKVIDECTEESNLKNELGLNSIAMLYLVVVLQEKFDISFDDAKMEDFKVLGDVISYIEGEM